MRPVPLFLRGRFEALVDGERKRYNLLDFGHSFMWHMNPEPGRKHTCYYRFEDLVEEIKGLGASVCPVAFLVEEEIGNAYSELLSEQFKSALKQGIE